MKKICFIVSSEMTVRAFLLDQLAALSKKYDVTVIANTGTRAFLSELGIKADVFPVALERRISLLRDIKAFLRLVVFFSKNRFNLAHSVTPKAGLLAMSAAFFAGIPIRLHTFTGQVWATCSGPKRFLLKLMDRILAAFTTNILVDSRSQREFLIEQGVISENKSRALLNGSISGVDTRKFKPDTKARKDIRSALNIDDRDILFLFLGRLNKDKGLIELAAAFSRLCLSHDKAHLLVVGPDEENIRERMSELCAACIDRLHFVDFTSVPEQYMAAADVFCLPSRREGFGSVIIEAAAAGVPSIGSRIYGIIDAVEDNITGLLFETGNTEALTKKLAQIIEEPGLRQRLGKNARERAVRDFSQDKVTRALLDFYENILFNPL